MGEENKKYCFPPISLLRKGNPVDDEELEETLKETALKLQQTLIVFGVRAYVVDINCSPLVTRFELQLEQGTKISKVVGLSDDIKLNLVAKDIRIEAPIPGKSTIGIEIPNNIPRTVALRELIESKEFRQFDSCLACVVGIDFLGNKVIADLAQMPHLLIGGTTGSGKTTFINSVIIGILYKAHPNDVKMIMIDTKYVNLSMYNGFHIYSYQLLPMHGKHQEHCIGL